MLLQYGTEISWVKVLSTFYSGYFSLLLILFSPREIVWPVTIFSRLTDKIGWNLKFFLAHFVISRLINTNCLLNDATNRFALFLTMCQHVTQSYKERKICFVIHKTCKGRGNRRVSWKRWCWNFESLFNSAWVWSSLNLFN